VSLERPVGFRVELVAVEDDEPCIDASAAERVHVRPRHPRRVDRAVDDAKPSAEPILGCSVWKGIHPFGTNAFIPCKMIRGTLVSPWVGGGLGWDLRSQARLDLVEVAKRRAAGAHT